MKANFLESSALFQDFAYDEIKFKVLKPSLLKAYEENELTQEDLAYILHIHDERVLKTHRLGNLIQVIYQGEIIKSNYLNTPSLLKAVNEERKKYALIKYQTHVKACEKLLQNRQSRTIINYIYRPKYFTVNGMPSKKFNKLQRNIN